MKKLSIENRVKKRKAMMKKASLYLISAGFALISSFSNNKQSTSIVQRNIEDSTKVNFDSAKVNFFAIYKTTNADSQKYYENKALHYFYKVIDTTKKQMLEDDSRTAIVWLSDMYWNKSFTLTYNLYNFVGNTYADDPKLIELLTTRFKPDFRSPEFINAHQKELVKLLHQKDSNYSKYFSVREALGNLYDNDQHFRSQLTSAENDPDKTMISKLNDSIRSNDEKNIAAVNKISATHGWLETDKIGSKASSAIFLVIQHSDSTEFEKFKPLIEKAFREKRITSAQYALYIDRYNVYTTGKQVYGTQFRYDSVQKKQALFPFKDPANVNAFRREIGLPPIRL